MPGALPASVADNSAFGGPTAVQADNANVAIGAPRANIPNTPGYNPTGGPQTPPSEPTVLSSSNITNNVIPKNTSTLADLQQKGTYIAEDGNTYYSDGSLAWQGQLAPGQEPPGIDNPEGDPDIAQINKSLGGLKAMSDAGTKQQLDSVHQMFGNRAELQKDMNTRVSKSTQAGLINAGTDRYAQNDSSSIMTATEKAGMASIATLESQENSAIAKANQAQVKGDQQAMDTALKEAQQIRTQKQTAANKLADQVQSENTKRQTAHAAALTSEAIMNEFTNGNHDVAAITKALNDKGMDVTAAQVKTTVDALTPKAPPKTPETPNALKFTSAQLGKMYSAGLNVKQIQSLSDFYNGASTDDVLSSFTPQQQTIVHDALNGISTKPSAAGGTKAYTSGGLTYNSTDLGTGQSKLNESKGADGYVDPTVYQKMFDAWTGPGGGLAKDFLKNYPPKSYINPANTWLPQYLKSKTSSSSSSGRAL